MVAIAVHLLTYVRTLTIHRYETESTEALGRLKRAEGLRLSAEDAVRLAEERWNAERISLREKVGFNFELVSLQPSTFVHCRLLLHAVLHADRFTPLSW